jgi:hypothetical protein
MNAADESVSSDQIISEAESLKEEKFYYLTAAIAESRTALAKMINNEDESFKLKAKHQEYKVKFDFRHYVREIVIELDGNPSGKFELTWVSWTANKSESKSATASNNQVIFNISDLITGFSILPPEKMLGLSSISIKAVKVVGISLQEFHAKLLRLGTIERLRKNAMVEVENLKSNISIHDAEIEKRKLQADEISSNIKSLMADIDKVDLEKEEADRALETTQIALKSAESQLTSLNQTTIAVEKEITDKKSINSQLAGDIAKKGAALTGLKSQINLFPTEIKGFADEGASAISKYLILSFLPIALIFFLGYDLYESGKALASYAPQGALETIYLMAVRMPYVVVAFAIAGAAFKVSQIFAGEIIAIYRQRLNLTKLSILAKDVSDSSAAGLELDDDSIYEKRVYLKMLILREHLKPYLPDTFSYVEKTRTSQDAGESVGE